MISPANTSDISHSKPEPRVGRWVCVVLVGIVALQMVQNSPTISPDKIPGVSRGDISFTEDALPKTLGEWSRTKFLPPKTPDSLPDNQYWWTHSWQFQAPAGTAFVSFDQADWQGWHELTECYLANGWELLERGIHSESRDGSEDWPCVVATFQQGAIDRCLVIFSMFYSDGSPVQPRGLNFGKAFADANLTERVTRRFGHAPDGKEMLGMRALQCQVFLPYRQELSEKHEQVATDLHLSSRSLLHRFWRQRAVTSAEPRESKTAIAPETQTSRSAL